LPSDAPPLEPDEAPNLDEEPKKAHTQITCLERLKKHQKDASDKTKYKTIDEYIFKKEAGMIDGLKEIEIKT
jgi:hypothetical protein